MAPASDGKCDVAAVSKKGGEQAFILDMELLPINVD